MKKVIIHTDGACSGNPGPGGWAAILEYGIHRRELRGGFAETTNNRMELFAAIAALETLKEPCEVTLHSDSSYLVNAVSKRWLERWNRAGWRKADKQPVLNTDLWKRLLRQLERHRVNTVWIRGHADHTENNRCDELARSAARETGLPPDTGFRPEE